MRMPPSTVGPKAYIVRWGTWNKALYAFYQTVTDSGEYEADQTPEISAPISPETKRKTRVQESDRRDIKLGLRYKVLKRDSFKCALCGRSPATTPGLELHVDHVTPFSKGGKTVESNLQAACSDCNLGKGDRV
ncbi:MAG: HNH endonuclease [Nitrospinae bacterium]|nr:HNH endonuclease [Nitrospinota bacterium]